MQISSRFTIAIHMLTCVEVFKNDYKVTSGFLADSIQVNPVVIRKLLMQMKKAGLVNVRRGPGGVSLSKVPKEVTFLEIYRAVDCIEDNMLFHFHENPNQNCPVGKNIHNLLDGKLIRVQEAMERELASITLDDVLADYRKNL